MPEPMQIEGFTTTTLVLLEHPSNKAEALSIKTLPSPFMDPFALPSLVWHEQLVIHLDAVDILHLAQTSTRGRATMWTHFRKTMERPKYVAKTLRLFLYVDSWSLRIFPCSTESNSHSLSREPGGYLPQPRPIRTAFKTNSGDFTLFEETILWLPQIAFGNFSTRCHLSEAKNLRAVETLRILLRRVSSEKCRLYKHELSRDDDTVKDVDDLFTFARAYAAEMLTRRRMMCVHPLVIDARHYGMTMRELLAAIEVTLLEILATKKRELGEKCVYDEVRASTSIDHNSSQPSLDVVIKESAANSNVLFAILKLNIPFV